MEEKETVHHVFREDGRWIWPKIVVFNHRTGFFRSQAQLLFGFLNQKPSFVFLFFMPIEKLHLCSYDILGVLIKKSYVNVVFSL